MHYLKNQAVRMKEKLIPMLYKPNYIGYRISNYSIFINEKYGNENRKKLNVILVNLLLQLQISVQHQTSGHDI